ELRGAGSLATPASPSAPAPRRAREIPSTSSSSVSSSPREHSAVTPAPTDLQNVEPSTFSVQPEPADSDLQSLWSRLVEAVGRASPFTRTYLLEAHPISFAKNLFTIGFDPEFEDHIGLVDNARNHTLLQTKLLEL